ncbi:MAG: family 16 glycosylhydrolase [Catenulispora sp.]
MKPGRPRRASAVFAPAVLAVLLCACASTGGGSRASGTGGTTPPPDPASAPATSGSTPPGPGPWHLAFADDFPGTALDARRWVTCYDWNVNGCTNSANKELQWYQPSQVTVAGGAATLTAEHKDTVGSDGKTYPWRSGLLSTGRPNKDAPPRFTYTYGYLEASVKMPPVSPANDFFPAFWLLTDDLSGAPEIDIVELIGDHTTARFNFQWVTATGVRAKAPHDFAGPVDYSAGYHRFGLDWEPGTLTWYVDGVARASFANSVVVPARPLEILFDLALGGFAAPPTEFAPGAMSIDHVRLWQH